MFHFASARPMATVACSRLRAAALPPFGVMPRHSTGPTSQMLLEEIKHSGTGGTLSGFAARLSGRDVGSGTHRLSVRILATDRQCFYPGPSLSVQAR